MHLLYSALLALALVLTLPYWLVQALRKGKYRAGLGERLGAAPARLTRRGGADIWIHAVSVGEVLAVSGLVHDLRRAGPKRRVVISTTTATGQKLARDLFGAADVFYFPLDFAFAIRRYLRRLRPRLVVMAETECWPNFLRLARKGARVAVVNARISDRSFPRYRAARILLAPVLRHVDLFLAQSEEDAGRLRAIGAPPQRVQVSGNLKFDVKAPATKPIVEQLRNMIAAANAGPVLVCGSTVEGEEPLVFHAFEQVLHRFRHAVLILAPRHPERFNSVAEMAGSLKLYRRSQLRGDENLGGAVLVLDSIGELASIYSLATLAFIGGSMAPRGGHNILEPAQYGVPILVGPHTENFRDIMAIFRQGGALTEVAPEHFTDAVQQLLTDEVQRQQLGRRAHDVFHAQAGATARTVAALQRLLAGARP